MNWDKAQTRQLLELAWRKIHGQINQWQLIMIISTATQNIPAKLWTDYFVAVNLHPNHRMNFTEWIKNISPFFKTGKTAYFRNHEGSYYEIMSSVWKRCLFLSEERQCVLLIALSRRLLLVSIHGQRKMFCPSFFSLDQITKIKICHMIAKEHPEVIEGR